MSRNFIQNLLGIPTKEEKQKQKQEKQAQRQEEQGAYADMTESTPASPEEKQEQQEIEWKDVNKQVEYVIEGGQAQCKYHSSPTKLKPTSTQVMLQDKPYMTENDKDGKVNFDFKSQCTHPKWGKDKPPCKSVISLTQWKNVSTSHVDNYHPLLVKSTITCTISGEDIKIIESGQVSDPETIETKVTKEPRITKLYWVGNKEDEKVIKDIDNGQTVYLFAETEDYESGETADISVENSETGEIITLSGKVEEDLRLKIEWTYEQKNSADNLQIKATYSNQFGKDPKPAILIAKVTGIEKIEFLNEKNRPIKDIMIGGLSFSNFVYGEKIKIRVTTKNVDKEDTIPLKLTLKARNNKNTLDKIDLFEWKTEKIEKNKFETDYFCIPLVWYDETIEEYDTTNFITKIADQSKITEFFLSVEFNNQDPVDDSTLIRPYTYRRNYEELLGLEDFNGKPIEEEFYNKDFIIKDQIKAFLTYMQGDELSKFSDFATLQQALIEVAERDKAEIIKRAEKEGKNLWETACSTQVRPSNLDDRPLYWARNKMEVIIKRHPLFKAPNKDLMGSGNNLEASIITNGELTQLIDTFESTSRNYSGINFKSAPAGAKRIIITGFDPFQLDPTKAYGKIDQFNPSGILAQYMNGKTIPVCNKTINLYFQTCIFPLHYQDFDKGVVENTLKKFINSKDIEMVMTTSLNGGSSIYDVEKYAQRDRGETTDNLNIGKLDNKNLLKPVLGNPEITKTSLLNNSPNFKDILLNNQNTDTKNRLLNIKEPDTYIRLDDGTIDPIFKTLGSGGDYLSNEVMYRTTKLRGHNEKPVGHFHLGYLYNNISRAKETIEVIEKFFNAYYKKL